MGESSKIYELLEKRNANNKNINMTLVGLPGSGKSYGGISLLMGNSGIEDEEILKHVHFKGEDYLKAITKKKTEYTIEFLDDVGYQYSSREWYKDENIKFIKEIQVARMDFNNIMVSTPHPRLADGALSTITHLMIVFDYWASTKTGKANVRKHIIKDTEHGVKDIWDKVEQVQFKMVPPDIAMAYEEKKRKDLREVINSTGSGLDPTEEHAVTMVQSLRDSGLVKSYDAACATLGIEPRSYYRWKGQIKKNSLSTA